MKFGRTKSTFNLMYSFRYVRDQWPFTITRRGGTWTAWFKCLDTSIHGEGYWGVRLSKTHSTTGWADGSRQVGTERQPLCNHSPTDLQEIYEFFLFNQDETPKNP